MGEEGDILLLFLAEFKHNRLEQNKRAFHFSSVYVLQQLAEYGVLFTVCHASAALLVFNIVSRNSLPVCV